MVFAEEKPKIELLGDNELLFRKADILHCDQFLHYLENLAETLVWY